MVRHSTEARVRFHILQIGEEQYRIYGHDRYGWSIDEGDLPPWQAPVLRCRSIFRYRSLDEIVFALVNLHLSVEHRA